MLLSVVVPCHNEERVLPELVAQVTAAVRNAPVDLEIVLVDDGSRDRTPEVLRELHAADRRVRYVSLSRNFGKEPAMLAGLAYARGDAVAIMNADLQHPPRPLLQMLELFDQGHDQVVARRDRAGYAYGRTLLARLCCRLVNALVNRVASGTEMDAEDRLANGAPENRGEPVPPTPAGPGSWRATSPRGGPGAAADAGDPRSYR